jgi:uncharacterized membrane protein
MTKQFTSLLLFLLPLAITYAIVSSIGTEGNHYSAPDNAAVSHQSLSQPHID